MPNEPLVLSPGDFVAMANQTLEYAFGVVCIEGELSSFRVSKGKWLYFDLKDEYAKVPCFGTVYMLPGPLQDGMLVRVVCTPRLHPQFGFSLTVQSIALSGEGTIRKAFELLYAKLETEGLFAADRKRNLPEVPQRIALVASVESAAYADFVKVLGTRWPYVQVDVFDTQVQGDAAPEQLVRAIQHANKRSQLADVLVVTRGGGSVDDMAAFNDERVVRAVAASRIPTLVAIGHEVDISLAELAADVRASTPSNAAELVVPDQAAERRAVRLAMAHVASQVQGLFAQEALSLQYRRQQLARATVKLVSDERAMLRSARRLLAAYDPQLTLRRGYSLVYSQGRLVTSVKNLRAGQSLHVSLYAGKLDTTITTVYKPEMGGDYEHKNH